MMDVNLCRNLFKYDSNTGNLIWETCLNSRAPVGAIAGNLDKTRGYTCIQVQGKRYYLHQLVWLYHTGNLPKQQIDHINRNTKDNRIENLREVTASQNQMNRSKPVNNKSGYVGVSWHSRYNKWRAYIQVSKRKSKQLGFFETIEEAIKARTEAELETYGIYSARDRTNG